MTRMISNTLQFPYKRSLGPVYGAFMTGIVDGVLLGVRCDGQVLCPPVEWNPATGEELLHDFVEVGPAGTVTSWTWVAKPTPQHPFEHPFAFASIRLDGADTDLVHAVDAGDIDAMSTGMRVVARFKPQRVGRIDDIWFVPGDEVEAATPPPPDREPVTMMDYHVSVTYTEAASEDTQRVLDASANGVLLGQTCPTCGRTYQGARGYCPLDSTAMTPEHDVQLPLTGVITNYTIVTPVQYPGQTETEPFARVMVLLDGTDVVLAYQPVIELPVADLHPGIRVAAVFPSEAERATTEPTSGPGGATWLLGWIPTGEPDVDDPDLVNRIY